MVYSQPSRLTSWNRYYSKSLSRWLHEKRQPSQATRTSSPNSKGEPLSLVCISDTHCTQPRVPDGDVLLHAGDLTNYGTFEELQAQLDWLGTLPHRYKVVIGGNHDRLLDPDYVRRFPDRIYEGEGTARTDLQWHDVIYLKNSSTRLDFPHGRSLHIYGSPMTEQCGTFAFQYPPIRQVWADTIPQDTDVLLTHGPPKGYLDLGGKGCPQLLREIRRAKPRLVVFGHIHAGRGRELLSHDGVEAAYDSIMIGDRGLSGVLIMACLILWRWLWSLLTLSRWEDRAGHATLVNAAVVGGRHEEEESPAIIVEI